MFYSIIYPSLIDVITLASDGDCKSLFGLWMEGQKYYYDTILETMVTKADIPLFTAT